MTLEVEASKARSDAIGRETPVAMGTEMLDIGVLDARGSFAYLQKHPISQGRTTVTVVVEQLPVQAGIDPRHLRMDRRLEDNVVARFVAEFASEGLELHLDDEVLDAVVAESERRQTGARGLQSVLTRALEDVAFDTFRSGALGEVHLVLEDGRIVARHRRRA